MAFFAVLNHRIGFLELCWETNMRRHFGWALASVMSVGLGGLGSASAADMAVKARPMVAPPPVIFSWTGCYIGAEGGGNWGRSRTRVNTTGEPFQDAFDISGGIAGGEWGCNYQMGQFVIGYEGDFSWTNKKGTAFDGRTAGNALIPITVEERWISTQRGRLGWAWDRVLLFVTGGVAFTDARWSGALLPSAGFAPAFIASDSMRHVGWVVGAGIEYAITNNWSVKGEYLYTDLGSQTICSPACVTPFGPFAARSVSLTDNMVRVGVNYRWNWAAPLVAKY
jgi:outer membrane immunogenic protein